MQRRPHPRNWRHGGVAAVVRSLDRPYGRRRSDYEPHRGLKPTLAVISAVALLDWTVKVLVVRSIPLGGFVEVWEGRVALWHVRNPEMVLGLWGNLPLGGRKVIAITAALAAFVIFFELVSRGHRLPPHRQRWAWLFMGLAFGGMLGNLGERALHWGVTDYLSFGWRGLWLPPGNVADLALFLSMPLAAAVVVFELQARAQRGSGARASERRGTGPPAPGLPPGPPGGGGAAAGDILRHDPGTGPGQG